MDKLLKRIYTSTSYLIFSRCKSGRGKSVKNCASNSIKKGLVLGAYKGILPSDITFTPTAQKFDSEIGGKLKTLVLESGLDVGKVKIFSSVHSDYHAVAVAGISSPSPDTFTWFDYLKEYKEKIRVAAGIGAMALQNMGIPIIEVESMADAEAAAEGAALGIWQDQQSDTVSNQVNVKLFNFGDEFARENWETGYIKAEAQNLARHLSGTPSNIITPSKFASHCRDILSPYGIQVKIRDRQFIKQKQMDSFWAITAGSCDTPSLIEMHYKTGDLEEKPIILVGKGCTFDFGGLCNHPHGTMSYHHGGMAAAASIVGVFKALCHFKLPINVIGMLPLYENIAELSKMTKKEKIFNSVIDDMAVLRDVMSYAVNFKPSLIINIAARLRTMDEIEDHDTFYDGASFSNTGTQLLKEFLPDDVDFCHIVTDTKKNESEKKLNRIPYLRSELNTGRPTRMLIQFLLNKVKLNDTIFG